MVVDVVLIVVQQRRHALGFQSGRHVQQLLAIGRRGSFIRTADHPTWDVVHLVLALTPADAIRRAIAESVSSTLQTNTTCPAALLLLAMTGRNLEIPVVRVIRRQRIQWMRSVPSPCGHRYVFAVLGILGIDGRPAVNLIASVFEHLPHLKFHIHFKMTSFFFPPFLGSFSSTEWQLGRRLYADTFPPPGTAIPLPVDPSEEASEEPIEDDREAVLLALLC